MENFTPLDPKKLGNQKEDKTNTVLLIVATITALVLAVLLFILIQKKLKQTQNPKGMIRKALVIS
jgi:hypothetical protein